ncbi:MAG: rhodanese-like domain-containing protein [Rudaea sp.]|uniref:rhodanese-like domain-containing protein n=1 Tax=unclassified Rudaea TaxID=2627037 RepID=UPI0010F78870|nr:MULTISPECIES: rhodanese-like domain-containing protein [unclassified Rudaea]MBN8886868.1 rhodanese-like domain-containing protein [Rudaea sp.]MBR0344714.1 rhodanese-like domain-containing protein [Rudaea sp.]
MSDILHRLPEFIGNHLVLVTLFLVVLVSLIGNEISRFFRGYRELTPAALTQLINRESPLVVDLSAPGDFEKAHIPGARNVQLSQFDPENKDLAPVKDRPVAVYCRAGTTSAQAAAKLVKAGFKQVFWLGGGLAAWREANLPVAKGR